MVRALYINNGGQRYFNFLYACQKVEAEHKLSGLVWKTVVDSKSFEVLSAYLKEKGIDSYIEGERIAIVLGGYKVGENGEEKWYPAPKYFFDSTSEADSFLINEKFSRNHEEIYNKEGEVLGTYMLAKVIEVDRFSSKNNKGEKVEW